MKLCPPEEEEEEEEEHVTQSIVNTHHTFAFVPLTNFSLYTPAIELKHETNIIVVTPVAI